MAKMVTRTIMATKAKVFCVNSETEETSTIEITVAGTFKETRKMLKAAAGQFDDNIIPIKVISTDIIENLYAMTEDTFMENAKVLPPRGTKKGE